MVEDTWICDLRDPETFYANVTALELLNHPHDCSGGLHALDMVLLTIQMSQYYKGTPIIPKYTQLLEDAQCKAARAGLPVTNQTLTILASLREQLLSNSCLGLPIGQLATSPRSSKSVAINLRL
jgi:hypothetical protein